MLGRLSRRPGSCRMRTAVPRAGSKAFRPLSVPTQSVPSAPTAMASTAWPDRKVAMPGFEEQPS